jgi:hypothetical protein
MNSARVAVLLREASQIFAALAEEIEGAAPERRAPPPPTVTRVLPEREPTDLDRAKARRAMRRAGL